MRACSGLEQGFGSPGSTLVALSAAGGACPRHGGRPQRTKRHHSLCSASGLARCGGSRRAPLLEAFTGHGGAIRGLGCRDAHAVRPPEPR